MRPLTLAGLAAFAAVAGIAAVVVSPSGDAPDAKLGQRIFPELAARSAEVRSIELQRPDGTIVILRDGEIWRVPARNGYAADTAKVRQLFVEVADLRTLEAKTRSKDLYASLEVEDREQADAKSTRLAFKAADGKEILALLAGKNRFGRGGGGEDAVYVRRAGDPQAWLAKGRLTVSREALHWVDRDVTNIARDRVREASVRHADGTQLVLRRATATERDFAIVDMPADRKPKSSWELGSVAGGFDRLELDDVRKSSELVVPADAPATTVTTFDGLTLTARFAEADGGTWVAISAQAAPPSELPAGATGLKTADEVKAEAAALNGKLGPWVYKLPAFNLESLRRKLDDLLEPKAS